MKLEELQEATKEELYKIAHNIGMKDLHKDEISSCLNAGSIMGVCHSIDMLFTFVINRINSINNKDK